MKFVISSGHGQHIRGASGYIDEVDEAREVVEAVATKMRTKGATVITFHDNTSTSQSQNLDAIVNFHNKQTRDWDVSVHFNAYNTTSKPMGSEVLYVSGTGQEMADDVVDSICAASGLINRGPKKRTDLAFLNGTEEPAVLLEVCFVDSKADVDIYHAKFDAICEAIAVSLIGESAGETPPPVATEDSLTIDQVIAIMTLAQNSAIRNYSWNNRGKAPLGMTEGLAVMYGQMLKRLENEDSVAMAMSEPIGESDLDALQHYDVSAYGRVNVLRQLFVMLYGLAMRESSGNYTEGRDMSADNVSADTAEAGMFQQSWNSHTFDQEMEDLLPAYEDQGRGPGYVKVFERGITKKNTDSYGSGDGFAYQELAKSNPAFGVEMCGVGLRCRYDHWGPVKRFEVEMRPEAEQLLVQVEGYMNDEEPAPPDESVAAAKTECMTAIEAAVDKLIADLGMV